jgi:hypothetical protein
MMRSLARVVLCCLVYPFVQLPANAQSLQVKVSPTNMVWDTNLWVTVTATNLTPGADVNLWLFADIDRNGALSTPDITVGKFPVKDGVTNALGASIVPHDTDGVANGAVVSRISYYGIDAPYHTIGSYLWAASTGSMPIVTRFDVTQPTSTVWITGSVGVYGYDMPATGAIVMTEYFFEHQGVPPKIWTDTNGVYRLYLPPSVPTSAVHAISCVKPGCFAIPFRDDTMEFISAYLFTNDLAVGANVVTNQIKIVAPVPGLVYTVSGRVEDAESNPIAGAWVFLEPDEKEGFAMAVSDTNGNFSLPAPEGFEGSLLCGGHLLNMRGFAGDQNDAIRVTNDVMQDLHCPAITILAKAQVTDVVSGDPVSGVEIRIDAEGSINGGYSLNDGWYEVGIVSNDFYMIGTEPDNIRPFGYANSTFFGGVAITNSGLYSDAPIQLMRGYLLSGAVFDRNTNALTGGALEAFRAGSWTRVSDSEVDRHAAFEMLMETGSYRVTAFEFPDYLDMNYTNHFMWEWEGMAPKADPVIVTTSGVQGINFYLEPKAYIRGTVRSAGVPISNVTVMVNLGWDRIDTTFTSSNGTYELGVLTESNYIVQAEPPADSFWMFQYYSNKTSFSEANAVTTTVAVAAQNIDFDLAKGGRVEGMMFGPNGTTPITNHWGLVEIRRTNDEETVNATAIYDSGSYQVVVPAGIYWVRAHVDDYLDQYYRGVYEYQRPLANVITVVVDQITAGIDFTMLPPSRLSGMVTSGGQPVTNMTLYVEQRPDTNDFWFMMISTTMTTNDGTYEFELPPGTNFIVHTQGPEVGFYLQKYWSNVTEYSQATMLNIGPTSSTTGINFDLIMGMRIEGLVLDENEWPLTNVPVRAYVNTTNGPVEAGWANTDDSGHYGMVVPATTSYFVRVEEPWYVESADWWYPEMCFNGRYSIYLADYVKTNAGSTVGGVEFRMYPGYRVQGQVFTSDGTTPAPVGHVASLDALGNPYLETHVDWFDGYDLVLPTNTALYLQGGALDYVSEYFSNTYDLAAALPFQKAAMTTTFVNFVLYANMEDHDSDGRADYLEDIVPDGQYVPAQDWANYTNADTDGDAFYDVEEYHAGTSPKDASSFLHCVNVVRSDSSRVITWAAAQNVNYMVQRCSNLSSPSGWTDWMPVLGTGAVMTVTDNNPDATNSAYRVKVSY